MQHMRAQGEPAQTPRPLQLPQTGPTPPGAFYMGPLRAGSVAAASVDDQPSSNSLAFAGEPKGSSSVMAPASGLLRGRCGPGCPAMGARSLQAAHCSARPHSQLLLYAAALHVSYATPIRCHHRTAAPAQLNLIACSEASGALAGRSWPSRPLPAGAPFPLGVSAAVGSRPTARAAAPRAEWASPGPSSGKVSLAMDRLPGFRITLSPTPEMAYGCSGQRPAPPSLHSKSQAPYRLLPSLPTPGSRQRSNMPPATDQQSHAPYFKVPHAQVHGRQRALR